MPPLSPPIKDCETPPASSLCVVLRIWDVHRCVRFCRWGQETGPHYTLQAHSPFHCAALLLTLQELSFAACAIASAFLLKLFRLALRKKSRAHGILLPQFIDTPRNITF